MDGEALLVLGDELTLVVVFMTGLLVVFTSVVLFTSSGSSRVAAWDDADARFAAFEARFPYWTGAFLVAVLAVLFALDMLRAGAQTT